jgi:pimeloyl-ACP methyl ester carboxylesterase
MKRLKMVADHVGAKPAVVPRVICTHGVGQDATSMEGLDLGPIAHCYDLPGHGKAAKLSAYSPQTGRDALQREVGENGRVVLVGHSLGAYLSLRYALEHPDRACGVCVLSGGPGFRRREAMSAWNNSYSTRPEHALAHHDDSFVVDNLGRLACPLLIVVGEKDKDFVAAAAMMKSKVPSAELVVVEGAGHMLPVSHAEQVSNIVRSWLEKVLKQ